MRVLENSLFNLENSHFGAVLENCKLILIIITIIIIIIIERGRQCEAGNARPGVIYTPEQWMNYRTSW